ncbi:MAG: hypothetical protein DYH12_27070 [Sorangiineae bacterium PRO1]|nr:hypothetical protein [Sorangiineae bacterium PRO1]
MTPPPLPPLPPPPPLAPAAPPVPPAAATLVDSEVHAATTNQASAPQPRTIRFMARARAYQAPRAPAYPSDEVRCRDGGSPDGAAVAGGQSGIDDHDPECSAPCHDRRATGEPERRDGLVVEVGAHGVLARTTRTVRFAAELGDALR